MENRLVDLKKDFTTNLGAVQDQAQLLELETEFFSRKSGRLTAVIGELKNLSPEERKAFGQEVNAVKTELEILINQKRAELLREKMSKILKTEMIDVTQPRLPAREKGHLHPNTQVQYSLEDLFASMGFMTLDGPELESEYYNFTTVNIPFDHPARDTQDTFYIKNHSNWLMRTHTSSMQIRGLQRYGAPIRLIAPGKCFRNEATDVRHEHTFYQLEGMVIDRDINFGHMKGILEVVARHLYGPETQVRLRPKFYPFVEPGVNGEVTCYLCSGRGCRLCKQSGWLEIFGAGLIHPNVLKAGGVNSDEFQGFAFGLGLTRLVMLKYGIEDIRLLESGDLRFLNQF